MIKRSFVLCFTFLWFWFLVLLFLLVKYNAAERISHKPNKWKYKHTKKRHSVTHFLIWSSAIMTSLPFCDIKKNDISNCDANSMLFTCKTFSVFQIIFKTFLRRKILNCSLKEIKSHSFFRQSLFFLIVVRRSLPRFPEQKNIIDISQ